MASESTFAGLKGLSASSQGKEATLTWTHLRALIVSLFRPVTHIVVMSLGRNARNRALVGVRFSDGRTVAAPSPLSSTLCFDVKLVLALMLK